MTSNRPSSEPQSDLVRIFVERSGVPVIDCSPERVMARIVERMRCGRVRNQEQRLQRALKERNVVSVDFTPNLKCDGMLEPIGQTFADGFKVQLKKNVSAARMRFSVAHEICHTFFYELVPEMKFRDHDVDEAEERLCNFGAAELLVPDKSLRASARKLPICLGSLEQLAENYCVSLPTMLIRLRALGLWDCELSNWHRDVNGGFVLDSLYGGRRLEWEWQDSSQLLRAWESSKPIFGTGFVYLEDSRGRERYKPISYNLRRSGSGVIALWGVGIRKAAQNHPLFDLGLRRVALTG